MFLGKNAEASECSAQKGSKTLIGLSREAWTMAAVK